MFAQLCAKIRSLGEVWILVSLAFEGVSLFVVASVVMVSSAWLAVRLLMPFTHAEHQVSKHQLSTTPITGCPMAPRGTVQVYARPLAEHTKSGH